VETELHTWIKSCFLEFRDLKMRLLLEEMKSALRFATTDRPTTGAPLPSASQSKFTLGKPSVVQKHPVKKLKKAGVNLN
jgi:hypothetical protein